MGDVSIYLLALIVITGLISYKGFSDANFFRKYEFHIGSIRAGEQIRMLSSGFLHGDFMHLIFNMYSLYMFGPWVIQSVGEINFFIIYFASLLVGNIVSYIMHKNELHYHAIGASGAVMGVIYAAIIIAPEMELLFFFIPMKAYVFGIIYLFYSIYGMKAKNDNIGHDAHLGGAIGGLAITLIKFPVLLFEQTNIILLMLIPILVFIVMAKMGKL